MDYVVTFLKSSWRPFDGHTLWQKCIEQLMMWAIFWVDHSLKCLDGAVFILEKFFQGLIFVPGFVHDEHSPCIVVVNWIMWPVVHALGIQHPMFCAVDIIRNFEGLLVKYFVKVLIQWHVMVLSRMVVIFCDYVLCCLIILLFQHHSLLKAQVSDGLGADDQVLVFNHVWSFLTGHYPLAQNFVQNLLGY